MWLANSAKPTPVVLSIHGGGFQIECGPSVTKETLRLLGAGISVIAVDYRLSQHAIAPAPFQDVARALQFIRSKATDWNLDKERIASTGNSAGAGLSLWLGYHEEMAQPRSQDPISRESTRLTCVSVVQAQTSYDPRFIRELMPGFDLRRHSYLEPMYDISLSDIDRLPKAKYRIMEEVSPINHVDDSSAPTLVRYNGKLSAAYGTHHASFGKALKEKMDAVGVRCEVVAGGQAIADSQSKSIGGFIKEEFKSSGWTPG